MIHTGDCLDVMATFDAESIDAIVTDPPYLLRFMAKSWDGATQMSGHATPDKATVGKGGTHDSGMDPSCPASLPSMRPARHLHPEPLLLQDMFQRRPMGCRRLR